MIFLNLFLINLLTTAADQVSDDGYCDADLKSCNSQTEFIDNYKLIFYDVNPPEGFNLRRDVYMRFAIMLAEARKEGKSDWQLVLPPWHKLYHWKTNHSKSSPHFWNSFFDVESLKSYAPVLELDEIFGKSIRHIRIDTLYVLQNFDDPFENGLFQEKWEIVDTKCEYNGDYWGFSSFEAKTTVCVRFQGKISKLWDIISMHPLDKKVMFMHAEIPLHINYGTKTYWDCRKSMKFNRALVKAANKFISKILECKTEKCPNYLAIHWRRRDFAYSRPDDVSSITNTVKQIRNTIEKHIPDVRKIFIATDADTSELKKLRRKLKDADFKVFYYDPSDSELKDFGDGGVAIIDQMICSRATYFIGTHDSTFSFRIQEEREIIGFDSNTTFNRLCPDNGPCEKPSRWQIVN